MYELPGYDAWKTTAPDPVFTPTTCADCDTEFDAAEEFIDGDTCPDCEGTLLEVEPPEPCYCGDTCYC